MPRDLRIRARLREALERLRYRSSRDGQMRPLCDHHVDAILAALAPVVEDLVEQEVLLARAKDAGPA